MITEDVSPEHPFPTYLSNYQSECNAAHHATAIIHEGGVLGDDVFNRSASPLFVCESFTSLS